MAITLANMLTRQFKKRGTYEGYATSPIRLMNREEKVKELSRKNPTGGEWTKEIGYNPQREEMTVNFQSGYAAVYPGVDEKTFLSAKAGRTTKDGRPGSVGVWLHQNPAIKENYITPSGDHRNVAWLQNQ